MLERNLIRSLMIRQNYLEYRNYLDPKDFNRELIPVLLSLDKWHKNNNGDLDIDDFCNHYFADNPNNLDLYKQFFDALSKTDVKESAKSLLEGFKRKQLCEELSVTAYEVAEGKKSFEDLLRLTEAIKKPVADDKFDYVPDDLESVLDVAVRQNGLRWRLKTLNLILGSLRPGDFGFFYARPETGKTALLASEVTFMAEQLSENSPPILWFNNEEQGSKVKIRQYQASCGVTLAQLLSDPKKYQQEYLKRTKGKIMLVDSGDISKYMIEKYIDKFGASLIIVDQLDKINGFKADREDLRLGAIYQWSREIAKRGCPFIGVCQADGSGEGELFLTMANVANSKTSKNAEADWIVGIGIKDEPGHEFIRGLAACKNKLLGDQDSDPQLRHGKRLVTIRPDIMRYED